ncbi:MAG: ATP-binding protein [Acidobacteriaceae bacterium]|nr:ATP-binding protein [Acidobacteriaceae bacterium]
MRPLPIRIRLAVWYFAMFASAATLLSLVSFWMLQRSLDKIEYHDLQERADDVQVVLSHEAQGRTILQLRIDLAAIYDMRDEGKYLQVLDERGNWVYRSKRMIAQNFDLPAPDRLPKTGVIVDLHGKGLHLVRTLAYPITVRGMRYSVQTGIALDKSRVLLNSFRFNLLLLTPVVILLATAGGHLMSRKALSPVALLTAETRRINDRNLSIRLPVPKAKDEITDLACTLNQMLERIDRAFTSVRTFTGNASHELRTPISLLRTEIEVALLREHDEEEYREILSRLHEETVSMTGLVENLLSLARADGGADAITMGPIHVDSLFHQTRRAWQGAMNQAMLDFRVEIPDGNVVVSGDLRAIQRLLSILLENASKYTPPGGIVELSAHTRGERTVLCVRDTGVGIASEHQHRIFDRFYRVPKSGLIPAGSGLGLSLAKWIAERHGSQLTVESAPGMGSAFSFSLERIDTPLQTQTIDTSAVSVA